MPTETKKVEELLRDVLSSQITPVLPLFYFIKIPLQEKLKAIVVLFSLQQAGSPEIVNKASVSAVTPQDLEASLIF